MPFTVATWNVNSVRKRLDQVARLAADTAIDVLCLQETKVVNDLFPVAAVAGPVEVHSLYVPAGGDDPDPDANPKFAYKLAFLDALAPFLRDRAAASMPVVLTGDFNVAPLETDVWSHERLKRVITHTPVERGKLADLLAGGGEPDGGWTDALRRFVPADEKVFTWWSYRAADWRAADKGRRLDHIWVNPALAPALGFAAVHDAARDWPEPSDHAPVRAVFEFD